MRPATLLDPDIVEVDEVERSTGRDLNAKQKRKEKDPGRLSLTSADYEEAHSEEKC